MRKPNDFVKLKNKHLVMRFGLTGLTQSISILKVGSYFQLYRNGVELCARALDQDDVVIEKFPTEMLAVNALALAANTLHNQTETKPRWKKWILWIVAPLLLLCVLEIFYFFTLTGDVRKDAFLGTSLVSSKPEIEYDKQPAISTPLRPVLELQAENARLLQEAVRKEKYSITYAAHGGQDAKQTLYVFSDPTCSYCREFDAHLKTLSQRYTVHIFPVSVVGGERSLQISEQILCINKEARSKGWEQVLHGTEVGTEAVKSMNSCQQAVNENDQAFHALHLRGTPAILNGFGQEVPESIPHTADALDIWIQFENMQRTSE
jgi:TrbB protein